MYDDKWKPVGFPHAHYDQIGILDFKNIDYLMMNDTTITFHILSNMGVRISITLLRKDEPTLSVTNVLVTG